MFDFSNFLDAECPIPRNPKVVCGARVVGRFLFYLTWKVGFEGVIVGSLISRKTRHPKSAKYWVGVSAPRRIGNIDFPRSRSWSGPGAALASPRRDLSIRGADSQKKRHFRLLRSFSRRTDWENL